MKITEKAVLVAKTQLGKAEEPKGSNWGKPVQDYLASVGIKFPASWCAAFIYWCFNEAAKELKVTNPLIKTGGVLAHWNQANVKYKVVGDPQAGDIFIMDFGKGLGHTGIVTSVEKNTIHTIEGNSNDEGSREGFEVCERTRLKSSIKGYLRYAS